MNKKSLAKSASQYKIGSESAIDRDLTMIIFNLEKKLYNNIFEIHDTGNLKFLHSDETEKGRKDGIDCPR